MMKEYMILLDSVDKVKAFEMIVRKTSCNMDIGHGRRIVDAKSIMGLLSLNLAKPLKLKVYDADDKFDEELIKDFIYRE